MEMLSKLIGLLNGLIEAIGKVISMCLMLLPDSPFHFDEALPQKYMSYISFFVPVKEMLAIGSAWLAAILVYYSIQIILRWTKNLE